MHYAARLNSFISPASHGVLEALARIGAIEGVTHVDLNYPEHFETVSVPQMRKALEKHGLKMNALNMRFKRPFLRGAYANPSAEIRREAEALTEKAAQVCRDMGGDLIIIWLAYDGYDYAMQMDYPQAWNQLVQTLCTLCRDRRLRFAIEYKPYEERGFSLLDSYGTTSCLIRETGAQNLGMVLDFCHMLMKKENPAFAASLLLSQGKLYGVHLNDGEGHCDNGFMVGMCHPWKTLELLYYLKSTHMRAWYISILFPCGRTPRTNWRRISRCLNSSGRCWTPPPCRPLRRRRPTRTAWPYSGFSETSWPTERGEDDRGEAGSRGRQPEL